jgi:hypothetical protein
MSKLIDKFILDFKSGQLDKTDLIVIFIHPTIGLLIWYTYQLDLLDKDILRDFTGGYLFLLPLALVGLFFRKLRNIKFYLAWLTISVTHVYIYPLVKDIQDFTLPRGTSFDGLMALLPTLIMFQLLRQIYFSVKGQEIIISIRHYRMTMYEERDKRKMTWIEVLFSILLALTATLSGIILTQW